MAKSHDKLLVDADELAKELGIQVQTSELDYRALSSLVVDLKAKVKDQERTTQADEELKMGRRKKEETIVEEPKTLIEESVVKAIQIEVKKYVIAKGKSLTSLKGLLVPGTVVKPEYFTADEALQNEQFNNLVKKGYIVKR